MSECEHLFDKYSISGLREQWEKLPGTVSMKQGLCMVATIEALLAKSERMEKALRAIAEVKLDPGLGQIVGSEHYEKAWLDSAELAKEALAGEDSK